MFPNTFLKTFWQMQVRPEVFVAMSFADTYKKRFDEVIAPAVAAIGLKVVRVDTSKSGDSIITEILNGIAHCQVFLADVSVVEKGNRTARNYRNENVMFEVGIALACRAPSDVLLIRDDREHLLFDVSVIPHVTIDFTDPPKARDELQQHLRDRVKEQNFIRHTKVVVAASSLSIDELLIVRDAGKFRPPATWHLQNPGTTTAIVGVPRLLDKQMVTFAGTDSASQNATYQWTMLGCQVLDLLATLDPSKTMSIGPLEGCGLSGRPTA